MTSVSVNGENRSVDDGETVSDLLDDLGFDPQKVAVELDGSICPRAQFGQRKLVDGNRLEIVSFVGGG